MMYFWIFIYGIINACASQAAEQYGLDWVIPVCLVIYDGLLLFWICRRNQLHIAGLRWPKWVSDVDWLFLVALGLFPVCNLVVGNQHNPNAGFAVHMLCVALTEELFFRGFLQNRLSRKGMLYGIIMSNLVFSILHSMNFRTNTDPGFVLLQMVSAFGAGLCYGAACVHWKSIVPCVLAHFLTNITGAGVLEDRAVTCVWICTGLQTVFGLWMCVCIWKDQKSNNKFGEAIGEVL